MGSRRRTDDRPIKRRGPMRQPRRRILIVCEGEETEPSYFRAFQHEVRNPCVHVEIADETGVPRTVVEAAQRLKDDADGEATRQRDDNLRYDEVWGVFDIDDHPKINEAQDIARAHGIHLAISNPCFELWALLHFQDQRAHIARDKARRALKRYLPHYDKVLDFEVAHRGYPDAVRRAQELDGQAEQLNEHGRNPSTGVHRLTESIRRDAPPVPSDSARTAAPAARRPTQPLTPARSRRR